MKSLFILAFFIQSAFTSSEKSIDIQLINRKWKLVKTTNLTEKSVFHESKNTFYTFSDEGFSIYFQSNNSHEIINGTWNYISESQTLSCQIDNQVLFYKLIKLTEKTLIIQHIDSQSGDRIQDEFISVNWIE